MSERLSPERLAEIRDWPRWTAHVTYLCECLRDALGHAQQAEIDRLAGHVATYRAAVEGAVEFGDRYLTDHERELCRLGDDTEAAAKAHDQRLRLEGAREFVAACHDRWDERHDAGNNPDFRWIVSDVLADMERQADANG